MSHRYGVTIVFRGNVNANLPVTFAVDDPDTPAGRLQAVSDLANALGLDFQKVYVVSKIDAGATVPEVQVDSNGPVNFASTKVPAREAIETVAAVDSALAQINGAVTGDVTLPRRRMTAIDAAALIAKQTQTGWKAYYGLFRRGEEPSRLDGIVVDRTNQGQPITELPLLTYRSTIATPAPVTTSITAPTPSLPPATPNVATVPNTSAVTAPAFGVSPFGYSPYGYNPYAYNSYAYNPYAYNPYVYGNPYASAYVAPDGSMSSPGYVYTPGVGVEDAVPGYNAPSSNFGPGSNVVTIP